MDVMKYIIFALFFVSCSTSTQEVKEPEVQKLQFESIITYENPRCVDDSGDDLTCNYNKDCCDNFYCGYEPTKSSRQKYCLWEGND